MRLQSRGVVVGDEAMAHAVLKRVGYSRLRPYWHPFEHDRETHTFVPGTKFEDIASLYNFDEDLRCATFWVLGRIETTLRATWANQMALQSSDPFYYLNVDNYHQPDMHEDNVERLLQEWERVVEHDPQHKHFRERYCPAEEICPPVWLAVEVMSFGLLSKFYSNLRNRHPAKKEVAAIFGFGAESVSYLGKTFHLLALARNRIAHHSRFWDYRWTAYTLPRRGHGNIEPLASMLDGADTQSTYYVLSHTLFLEWTAMGSVSLARGVERALSKLSGDIQSIALRRMGFPREGLARWVFER